MSLLNPTPYQPTDTASRYAAFVKSQPQLLYHTLLTQQAESMRSIWQAPHGLTPQQVCDALGADAAKLFALHGLLTDFLIAAQQLDGLVPNYARPGWAFTANADGTVTIHEGTPYNP